MRYDSHLLAMSLKTEYTENIQEYDHNSYEIYSGKPVTAVCNRAIVPVGVHSFPAKRTVVVQISSSNKF